MVDDSGPQGSKAGADAGGTSDRLLPKGRLEAFSDGVFAIVVTLLVLELEVPRAHERLWHELAQGWPAFLGYLVSFAFIGGSWISHSNMTRFIKATDDILMRLNLLLLLFVSFLPFTTNLMATHLNDPGEGLAVVVFGLNLTLAALLVSVVVGYAGHTPSLAADDVAEEELPVVREGAADGARHPCRGDRRRRLPPGGRGDRLSRRLRAPARRPPVARPPTQDDPKAAALTSVRIYARARGTSRRTGSGSMARTSRDRYRGTR